MTVPLGYTQNRDPYRHAFRRRCHELLAMGYRRLSCHAFQGAEEPVITGELVRSMQDALEAHDAPPWSGYFAVKDDPPQNTEGRSGKRRRRIDIEIEQCAHGKRPRFRFEAKRLHNATSLKAYLGQDGLLLFVRGSYAGDNEEAGMLGYVQKETAHQWSRRVQQGLVDSSIECELRSCDSPRLADLAGLIGDHHESCHNRPSLGRPITIFHTFLTFC